MIGSYGIIAYIAHAVIDVFSLTAKNATYSNFFCMTINRVDVSVFAPYSLFVSYANARSTSVNLAALQRRSLLCFWSHSIFNIDV